MDKKKLLALIIFVFFGFFAFSFANPSEENGSETLISTSTKPDIDITGNKFKIEVFDNIPKFNGKVADNVTLKIENNINNKKVGKYEVTFIATDEAGLSNEIKKEFLVVDTTAPVITLNGSDEIIRINTVYNDLKAKARDNYDGDLTKKIVTKNMVDTSKKGVYKVTYDVTDSSKNAALTVTRIVTVVDDTELKNAIKRSKEYLDSTDDSKAKKILADLEKEIKSAEKIIDNEKSTQEEIDKETKKIEEIIEKINNMTFKVKFVDYNDTIISEQTVKYGNDATIPEVKERTGYTFKSWNKSEKNIKSDLVIKAEYNLITYKIEYDLNGGSETDNKTSYTIETKTFKLNKIEKQGYVFVSWEDESGKKVDEIKRGTTGDLSLKALFKESENTKYKIIERLENLDGTYKENEKVKTGKTNEKITLNDKKSGYKINKEKSILTGIIKADGSLVLTITYDLETYKAKFFIDNDLYKEENYKYGEKIKLPDCKVKEGYTFSSWNVDETMPSKDTSYYATTSKKEFIVTFKYYQNNALVETQKKVKYDETVEEPKYDSLVYVDGENPYYLEFKKWNKSLKNIKENTNIEAVYEKLGIATTRLYRLKVLNRPSNGAGRNPIWYEELGKNKKIKFVLSSNRISNIIAEAKKNKKHEAVLSLNQDEIYNYMTAESKIELKSIEEQAIKKYEKKNFLKKDCQFEWYVLKYNTNDGWHLDGEVTKCKSIFD